MAGVLLGPLFPQLSSQNFFLLIVAAIAAAAFAGSVEPPLALVGGLALGIGAQVLSRHAADEQHPRAGSAAVAAVRRAVPRPDPQAVAAAARRSSPIRSRASTRRRPRSRRPSAARASPRDPHPRRAWCCVGAVVLVRVHRQRRTGSRSRRRRSIFSIIFLSITVFTGMAGEISLAPGVVRGDRRVHVRAARDAVGRVGVRRHGASASRSRRRSVRCWRSRPCGSAASTSRSPRSRSRSSSRT